jgi:hypothetical protein
LVNLGSAGTTCSPGTTRRSSPLRTGIQLKEACEQVAKQIYGLPLRCKGVFALRIQDLTADDISGL